MRAIVLLNPAAGARDVFHDNVARVRQAFASAGVDAQVGLVQGENLSESVRTAVQRRPDVIVVGGGDGSIGCAAAELVDTGVALGVLPLGTLNHFARDLGVPLVFDQAVAVIAGGRRRAVDVGDVNGVVFVNNSCIGAYPHLVEVRVTEQRRRGVAKWRAAVRATLAVLTQTPVVTVTMQADGRRVVLTTNLVIVANNSYQTNLLGFGRRRTLDAGTLCVYAPPGCHRRDTVRSLARLLAGRPERDHVFQAAALTEIEIEAAADELMISLDGELRRLTPPLRYRIRPAVLNVIVPADDG